MNDKKLASKVAIVTGAAQGIGAAIARLFAQEDCFVYITDINDELGRDVAGLLGSQASYLTLDVRQEDDWRRVTAQVLKEHGRLDVLVNNAGITGFEEGVVAHDPEHASLEDWRAVHRTNLDGVFLGCKYAIRSMRHKGTGSIINISSRSGLVGIPGGRGLCIVQGRCAQPYKDRRALLCGARAQGAVQLHSSCGHPHSHMGADAGRR